MTSVLVLLLLPVATVGSLPVQTAFVPPELPGLPKPWRQCRAAGM
jgi:hypothetical protein